MREKHGTQYYLRENPFGEEGTFIAGTVTRTTVGLESIIRRMVGRGTTLTEIDLFAVIRLFRNEIMACIIEGAGVNIEDFFVIRPTISGQFNGVKDSFDSSRHNFSASINLSSRFIERARKEAIIEKIDRPKKQPEIQEVHDQASATLNRQVTIGRTVRLEGKNLAFDKEQADEGVFLLNSDASAFIKIAYDDIVKNGELRFIVPSEVRALGEEIYIEVKSRLKTKVMRFDRTMFRLKVVEAQPVTP